MNRRIFFILFSLLSGSIVAQNYSAPMNSLFKVDMGVSGIGYGIEAPLGHKLLLGFDAGLGGGYEISMNHFVYKWNLISPALYISARGELIYNRDERAAKDRRIDNNTGNLFGFRIKYASRDICGQETNYSTLLINAHWGIKRAIGRAWIFSTYIGICYAYDINYSEATLYPAFDLKFSYSIPLGHR